MNWTERVNKYVNKMLALQQPILDDCKKQRRQNREINGRWREGHREQFAKYQREYYQSPEAKRRRREYAKRPETMLKRRKWQRDHYWRHLEKMREKSRNYAKTHYWKNLEQSRKRGRENYRKYSQRKKVVIKQ